MAEIGQGQRTLIAAPTLWWLLPFLGSIASSAWLWPFAVDDSWIAVRYARHVVSGAGYVWNVGAPATDGVTPLPWALLLVPLAAGSAPAVLWRVKLAGAVASAVGAALVGRAVGRLPGPLAARCAAVVVLLLDLPVAAYAVSGLETPLATLLVTIGVLQLERPLSAAVWLGLAATLRPELVVFAVALAAAAAWTHGESAGARPLLPACLVAAAPFAACAVVRLFAFGRPAPLSVLAKPSDVAHGAAYAGAALVFSLAPLLLWEPWMLWRARGVALAVAVASGAHAAAIVAVGGDWMPFARLMVPVVPAMLYAFAVASSFATSRSLLARLSLVAIVVVLLVPKNVRALHRAGDARRSLIDAAKAVLRPDATVAAIDIGWLSSVTEGAVVDLAGVTDPDIATLKGGHTSKHVDTALLLRKAPELAVFYADPLPLALDDVSVAAFPRVTEARLVGDPRFHVHFRAVDCLPLGETGAGYVVYRRR